MPARFRPWDSLPLFASEEEISAAILGPGKSVAWRGISKILEDRGLPRIDGLHGGRYVPAVKAFYDSEYGVRQDGRPAPEPDRPAEIGKWDRLRKSGRRD